MEFTFWLHDFENGPFVNKSDASRFVYPSTRICEKELNSPNTFKSHNTTTITTTAFKMDLIVPYIGMKRLISQSKTPTTIKTVTTVSNGISHRPPC